MARKMYWIKWLICIALAAVFFLIPTSDIYTPTLQRFFAITVFVMAVVAFNFFDMAIPAFALPIAYILFQVAPPATVFAPWTGGTTIFMIIGAFVFSNLLDECGLLRRISYWTIVKLGGSFTGIVFAVFLAGAILSLLTFNNGYMVEVFLAYSVCVTLKLTKGSKEAALICCAGALGAQGLVACTYYPAADGLVTAALAGMLPDIKFGYFTRAFYNWPIFLTCFLTLFILTKFYKTKKLKSAENMDEFKKKYEELGKMTAAEKKAVVCSVILLVFLITSPIHKLPSEYAFLVLPWIMVLPGMRIGTIQSVNNIKLGVLFFIAGCMSIGTVGVAVGLDDMISVGLAPMLSNLGPFALMFAFVGLGALANMALTPFAMLSGLSVPFCQVVLDMGLNPMFSLMCLAISTAAVFMPHEIVCYAVLYSFGYIKMKDFIFMVGLNTIITFIIMGIIIFPWWNFIGLI